MKLYTYCLTTLDTKMPDGMVGVFDRTVYPVTSGGVTAFVSDVLEDSLAVNSRTLLLIKALLPPYSSRPLRYRSGLVPS